MKKKQKPAAEISHDEVTPPAGTALEDEAGDDAPEAAPGHTWVMLEDGTRTLRKDEDTPTGWDANGSEVTLTPPGADTTATVGVLAALPAEHPAPDLPDAPPAPAELALSDEQRAQIATHGHVLGRDE